MKRLSVTDEYNHPIKGWSFGAFKNHTQVGVCEGGKRLKPRNISGWQLNSPDGTERFNEGNYQQFVPFVQLIVSNYGWKTNIS